MGFSFYPNYEHGCPHVSHCPHLGGAALGTVVLLANEQELARRALHGTIDAERARGDRLFAENQRLQKELDQVKLELKLERQNKFATNKQKRGSGDTATASIASDRFPKAYFQFYQRAFAMPSSGSPLRKARLSTSPGRPPRQNSPSSCPGHSRLLQKLATQPMSYDRGTTQLPLHAKDSMSRTTTFAEFHHSNEFPKMTVALCDMMSYS